MNENYIFFYNNNIIIIYDIFLGIAHKTKEKKIELLEQYANTQRLKITKKETFEESLFSFYDKDDYLIEKLAKKDSMSNKKLSVKFKYSFYIADFPFIKYLLENDFSEKNKKRLKDLISLARDYNLNDNMEYNIFLNEEIFNKTINKSNLYKENEIIFERFFFDELFDN